MGEHRAERTETMNDIYISVVEVAKILHVAPQQIRIQARNGTLPFKAIISGNRVHVLRKSFYEYIGG